MVSKNSTFTEPKSGYSPHINPVHSVCFALIGAFMTVATIAVVDNLSGSFRHKLPDGSVNITAPVPHP